MSVTADKDVASGYADVVEEYMPDIGIVHKFNAPKGSPLVNPDVNDMWGGEELLMPRGVSFRGRQLILPDDWR